MLLTLVAGKVGLNIEIKSEGAGALTAAHLAGSGYNGPVLISSFKEARGAGCPPGDAGLPVSGIFDTFVPAK